MFTHLRDNDFDQEFPILMTNLALRVMFDPTDDFEKLKNFKMIKYLNIFAHRVQTLGLQLPKVYRPG